MMQHDALTTSWFKPIGDDLPLPTVATPMSAAPGTLNSRFRYRETQERIAKNEQAKKTEKALKEAFAPKGLL